MGAEAGVWIEPPPPPSGSAPAWEWLGSGEGSHALAASLDNRGTRERSLQGALQAYSKAVGYEPPKVEAAEEAEVEAEAGEEAMEEAEGE